MESLSLTTPISISSYRVALLSLDWRAAAIRIVVVTPSGEEVVATYSGSFATALMTQLNKLDMSTNSLHKRILDRLVLDGKLPAGTVTGSPD